jgi:NAD-dependent deacetylase
LPDETMTQAVHFLAGARHVCVSTGAGMSVESGIETFRGEDGLWSKVKVEEMATPEAFQRDPEKVWAWYRQRRAKLAEIEPHVGHRALAAWENRVDNFTVVTQNIDGLHHRAGSKNVIELHGRLDVARCTFCDYNTQTLDDLGPDPACPVCQKRLRPAVVWFGEALPPGAIESAFLAAQSCDVFLLIGTSGVVQPAASLGEAAKACGAAVIEVNPNRTELSFLADVCIREGCRTALDALDQAWRTRTT